MKQLDFDGLVKISNEGMKALKGGYTLHSVTVHPKDPKKKKKKQSESENVEECPIHGDQCDGDDGIHND